MNRPIVVRRSFAEAEKAEEDYYRSLTPQERMAILLELTSTPETDDEDRKRPQRVYRIVKLAES